MIVQIIPFFPLVMGMTYLREEKLKEKQYRNGLKFLKNSKMKMETEDIEHQISIQNEQIKRNKILILNILRLETVETSIQTLLQVTMLALYSSNTKTTSGLEAYFGSDLNKGNLVLLIMSLVWSISKGMRNIIKAKAKEAGAAITLPAKIIIGLRALLTNLMRTVSILCYFSPFLGLWNIFYHL